MTDGPVITCRWYALCDNAAVGATRHPVLGWVPVCQRCADKHDLTTRQLNIVGITCAAGYHEAHDAHMALNGECPWCGAGATDTVSARERRGRK